MSEGPGTRWGSVFMAFAHGQKIFGTPEGRFLYRFDFALGHAELPPPLGRGAWRMHPYSLYIVLHTLHHNAIVNAAAGVANSRRVSYIADAIARVRCAWPQRVANANSHGVGICNCARVADAIARRGC